MGIVEKILSFMFPTSMILSPDHLKKYHNSETSTFRTTMLFSLPIAIIVYVGHYFFFDLPMNLQPKELWFNYRFGISTLCLVGYGYYFLTKKPKLIPYKLPALLISFTICFLQTRTILWFNEVPFFYSFLFMVITSFTMRLTPWQSALYISLSFFMQASTFWEANMTPSHIYSGFVVSLVFGFILSSMRYFQTKVFVTNEILIDEQKKNIEQNLEFTRTLKSFLPKKISQRIDRKVAHEKLSIHQAVDEVLRPQSKKIACLACDIRGYTQKSKENTQFILNSVIPLTKTESQIVEDFEGIPRKIGDLLFTYYDSPNLLKNIINATLSGVRIVLHELESNSIQGEELEVHKQVIISTGEAYVGNIGGNDSAVEITALGTPVNFLSRLEAVVKTPEMIEEIPRDHVIISNEVKQLLSALGTDIEFNKYDLTSYGVTIKDFDEITTFYSIKATNKIFNSLEPITKDDFDYNTRMAS